MASIHRHHLSHSLRRSITSLRHPLPISNRQSIVKYAASKSQTTISVSRAAGSTSFTWDDVHRVSQPEYAPDDSADLAGFFAKIRSCNRGMEFRVEFLPFVVEDQIVGYVHNEFTINLKRFPDVFTFGQDTSYKNCHGGYVSFHPSLTSPEDRTKAVGHVVQTLGENVIPGIRNELYPVASSFGGPLFFSVERAAAPYFGTKAYGVHMNGYVEKDGQKYLWIGKRSQSKSTYPGMLDHLVAGGLPHGIACCDNVIKECEEEAGIPRSISKEAIPVGAVSYMDINGHRFKRDVLFCYDLKLPEDFVPINQDGEVESFKLFPVAHVANIIRRTQFFKSNCAVVIIDFLIRHGYITPENIGYLDLLQCLRSGDCS
ncbi:unnamed protein product [Rhodiola kirilowii]